MLLEDRRREGADGDIGVFGAAGLRIEPDPADLHLRRVIGRNPLEQVPQAAVAAGVPGRNQQMLHRRTERLGFGAGGSLEHADFVAHRQIAVEHGEQDVREHERKHEF